MIGWFGLDYKPLAMLCSVPQWFFSPENDTLEILDLYLIICDVLNQYLRLG